MIIYSKEPLNVQMLNLLLLEDTATGGYVYVNKEVFQQAVSLALTYDNNHDRIIERIKVAKVGAYFMNKPLMDTINYFKNNAPEPLGVLANYLIYLSGSSIELTDDMEQNMVKAYGILHMYSNFIDFYRYSLASEQVRTTLDLPAHVLNSYESSWEDLVGSLADKVVLEREVQVKEIVTRVFVDGTPYTHIESAQVPIPVAPMATPIAQPVPVAPMPEVAPVDIVPVEPEVQPTPVAPAPIPQPAPAPEPPQDNGNMVYVDAGALDDFEAKMKELERKALEKAKKKSSESSTASAPAPKKEDKPTETFGDSGALQISEQEIAADTLKILDEFDI